MYIAKNVRLSSFLVALVSHFSRLFLGLLLFVYFFLFFARTVITNKEAFERSVVRAHHFASWPMQPFGHARAVIPVNDVCMIVCVCVT